MTALADRLDPAQAARLRAVPDSAASGGAETALDLVAAVRQTAVGISADSSYALAERLIGGWTDEQCRVMLSALLPGYLRQLAEQQAEAASIQEWRERVARPKVASPTPNRVTTPQRVSDWYAQTLQAKVAVDGSAQGWKYLADCTADDLLHASARLHTKSVQMSRLANAVREEGVRIVAELSEPALRKALDEAAS